MLQFQNFNPCSVAKSEILRTKYSFWGLKMSSVSPKSKPLILAWWIPIQYWWISIQESSMELSSPRSFSAPRILYIVGGCPIASDVYSDLTILCCNLWASWDQKLSLISEAPEPGTGLAYNNDINLIYRINIKILKPLLLTVRSNFAKKIIETKTLVLKLKLLNDTLK